MSEWAGRALLSTPDCDKGEGEGPPPPEIESWWPGEGGTTMCEREVAEAEADEAPGAGWVVWWWCGWGKDMDAEEAKCPSRESPGALLLVKPPPPPPPPLGRTWAAAAPEGPAKNSDMASVTSSSLPGPREERRWVRACRSGDGRALSPATTMAEAEGRAGAGADAALNDDIRGRGNPCLAPPPD